ncbi:glycosyltransferase [Falsibacillus pallidus]|uniref:Cellulose synthase/poly-beta-1,6-N-acetylglucosamine synthase-like glycosyltransferase n=1 Tax=Falsibacillus pallidus TaxID=493781 RepID=A0A370GBN9_9BACI|nr:glycosyltransferase family 2 protein [Falsibacillus pallidus]RDI41242.1 cellulose synthase/poly-beta-1,6-N-acetylglucosamine synthase-like glycosyltransferase [Falsibacillus pallidus]
MIYLMSLILLIWIAFFIDAAWGLRTIERLESEKELEDGPLISIIVAAKNEEEHIRKSIESQLSQKYKLIEWILVNDRSEDRTGDIMDGLSVRHPHMKVIHIKELPEGWLGKNHALYKGYLESKGEWLLFTDADVLYKEETVGKAASFLSRNSIDHMTAAPDLYAKGFWLKSFVAFFLFGFSYYKRPWRANIDSSKIGVGVGAFNLIRKKAYETIGTHQSIKERPDDDLQLGMMVKKFGLKQRMVSATKLLKVEWYPSLQAAFKGLEKNTFAGLHYQFPMVFLAVAGVFCSQVLPFLTIFSPDPLLRVLSFIVVILIFSLYYLIVKKLTSFSPLLFFVFPATALLFIYSIVRAVLLTIKRGGIEWRGTVYSLKELRKRER